MPDESLTAVTDDTFEAVVMQSPIPVLVDFWAEWCPPCRPMAQVLAELAEEFHGQVRIVKLDVDANPETTRAYRVTSMPTLLFFRDGVVTASLVGARPKSVLRRALTSATTPYANV
jgi:thioredoxin 1